MSDLEFDVLDELYFVISFTDLQQATDLPGEKLKEILLTLFRKGWLKVFKSISEELSEDTFDLDSDVQNYYYLASKAGLLAHNGR